MSDNAFGSDAAYFDLLAVRSKDALVRKSFREVADAYLSLSVDPRAQSWVKRAEECRALADVFRSPECKGQLLRLAQTYEDLAKRGAPGS